MAIITAILSANMIFSIAILLWSVAIIILLILWDNYILQSHARKNLKSKGDAHFIHASSLAADEDVCILKFDHQGKVIHYYLTENFRTIRRNNETEAKNFFRDIEAMIIHDERIKFSEIADKLRKGSTPIYATEISINPAGEEMKRIRFHLASLKEGKEHAIVERFSNIHLNEERRIDLKKISQSDQIVFDRSGDSVEKELTSDAIFGYFLITKFLMKTPPDSRRYIIVLLIGFSDRKAKEEVLRQAVIQAQQSAQSRSMFLVNMTHEIRISMNSILGMAELLYDAKLEKEQREWVEIINISGIKSLSFIHDILDFSKIEAGFIKIESIEFNLSRIIEEVEPVLHFKANEKSILLSHSLETSLHQIELKGDAVRIRQVLINLINNALKYTSEGEMNIIGNIIFRNSDHVKFEIEVKDSGIGIPKADREKIFEGFNQLKLTDKNISEGTGLESRTGKSLVEMMDGMIGFGSEFGQGNNFWITLYFLLALEILSSLIQMIKKPRILLAEDIATNRKEIGSCSNQRGIYSYDLAIHGKQALENAKDKKYDLMQMDIQMPQMDGIRATQHIRRHNPDDNPNVNTSILVITAYSTSADAYRFYHVGMNVMMHKPFLFGEFPQTIENLLGEHFFQNKNRICKIN